MTIPVILDTDIGFDVDDVWALALLLKCPELDVKLITTATGDTTYRAAVVAKMLCVAGREDIPLGIGLPLDDSPRTHAAWLGDFSLRDFPGQVYRDGIGAICETALDCDERVTIIGIGPLPNLAAALAREPELPTATRFVGMHGSLRRGYLGAPKPMREYNVKQYALAARAVLSASWDKTITPLDTCGNVVLDGERFKAVCGSEDPLTKAVVDNHRLWFEAVREWPVLNGMNPHTQSSILYDSVAIYLALSEAHLDIETLGITVTPDGKTLIDEDGSLTRCATEWRDKEAYLDWLVERLA